MNVKTLFAYMNMCRKIHTVPSVLGLKMFDRISKIRKEKCRP